MRVLFPSSIAAAAAMLAACNAYGPPPPGAVAGAYDSRQ